MKFIVIAAAAALAITAEEAPETEQSLVEVDNAMEEFPTEEELPEVDEDEEGWGKVRRGCKKLRYYWYKYKHLGTAVKSKFRRAANKRYHGRTVRTWCAHAGVRLGF